MTTLLGCPSCMFTVKHRLCLMNWHTVEESDQFRFLRSVCFANLKGVVGLIKSQLVVSIGTKGRKFFHRGL